MFFILYVWLHVALHVCVDKHVCHSVVVACTLLNTEEVCWYMYIELDMRVFKFVRLLLPLKRSALS